MAVGDLELSVGDRVMALKNDRGLGLLNGTPARSSELRMTASSLRSGRASNPRPAALPRQLTHAYALTIHKAQGLTCDVALLLGDDTLFAEAGYTGITRGRARNQLYVVHGEEGDGLDPVRQALQRSAAKHTAIEQLGVR